MSSHNLCFYNIIFYNSIPDARFEFIQFMFMTCDNIMCYKSLYMISLEKMIKN